VGDDKDTLVGDDKDTLVGDDKDTHVNINISSPFLPHIRCFNEIKYFQVLCEYPYTPQSYNVMKNSKYTSLIEGGNFSLAIFLLGNKGTSLTKGLTLYNFEIMDEF
jgi:hypothetical protein